MRPGKADLIRFYPFQVTRTPHRRGSDCETAGSIRRPPTRLESRKASRVLSLALVVALQLTSPSPPNAAPWFAMTGKVERPHQGGDLQLPSCFVPGFRSQVLFFAVLFWQDRVVKNEFSDLGQSASESLQCCWQVVVFVCLFIVCRWLQNMALFATIARIVNKLCIGFKHCPLSPFEVNFILVG